MDLKVGQKAVLERVFTQEEFNRFAVLSGDDNPIHVDPEFSSRTKFGRTVAHGMFLYSNISRALGEILHGFAFAQLEQEMIFQAPTYTREKVEIRLEVLSLGAGGQAEIKTDVVKPDGQFGCQGRTIVSLPGSKVDRKDLQDDNKSPNVDPGTIYKGLANGQKAEMRRMISKSELREYIHLSGDQNPLFSDLELAHKLGFRDTPVPGPLFGSLFSCLLGTRLPGRGTNWLKQKLFFPAPAYPSEELEAEVEITRIRPEKDLVNLRGWVRNPAGDVVCEGESLVLVKDLENTKD